MFVALNRNTCLLQHCWESDLFLLNPPILFLGTVSSFPSAVQVFHLHGLDSIFVLRPFTDFCYVENRSPLPWALPVSDNNSRGTRVFAFKSNSFLLNLFFHLICNRCRVRVDIKRLQLIKKAKRTISWCDGLFGFNISVEHSPVASWKFKVEWARRGRTYSLHRRCLVYKTTALSLPASGKNLTPPVCFGVSFLYFLLLPSRTEQKQRVWICLLVS